MISFFLDSESALVEETRRATLLFILDAGVSCIHFQFFC